MKERYAECEEEALMGFPVKFLPSRALRDYHCQVCGQDFEAISREASLSCPECGGASRAKLSLPKSRPQFKCGGFHDTDY